MSNHKKLNAENTPSATWRENFCIEPKPTELSIEAQQIFLSFFDVHRAETIEKSLDETLLDIHDHPHWHRDSYFRLYELKKIMRQMQKSELQPYGTLCPTVQEMLIDYLSGNRLYELIESFNYTLYNIHGDFFDCHPESYDIIFGLIKLLEKWQWIDLFPTSYPYANAENKILKARDFCDESKTSNQNECTLTEKRILA